MTRKDSSSSHKNAVDESSSLRRDKLFSSSIQMWITAGETRRILFGGHMKKGSRVQRVQDGDRTQ